jgi:hypothetical protein
MPNGNPWGAAIVAVALACGLCYLSTRPMFPDRVQSKPAAERAAGDPAIGAEDLQNRLRHMERWGTGGGSSGTDGTWLLNCFPDPLPSDQEADATHVAGKCVEVIDDEDEYTFDFVPAEFAARSVYGHDDVAKLPSFARAVKSAYLKTPPEPYVRRDGALARGQTCAPGRLCWSNFDWDRDDYDNEDIGPADPACWTFNRGIFSGLMYLPCDGKDTDRAKGRSKWSIEVAWSDYQVQTSGGGTLAECKALMPDYITGFTYSMSGADVATVNRGNLDAVRCYESAGRAPVGIVLADRSRPVSPLPPAQPELCVQGGSLKPGESCAVGQ